MSGTDRPGSKNSSITRVRPILGELLARHPSGAPWLGTLLRMATENKPWASSMANEPGALQPENATPRVYRDRVLSDHYGLPQISLPSCFEKDTHPPEAFLKWLIAEASLQWPKEDANNDRKFEEPTQSLRKGLFDPSRVAATRRSALELLGQSGSRKSRRKWWAFEGFTSVDCCLETDKLLLLIEGKRTEGFSVATDWYPARHQIGRNLEVAREHAKGRDYAVMVLAEEPVSVSEKDLDASWPHLDPAVRQEMKARYLGCATWAAVCSATGLDWGQYRDLTSEDVAKRYREAQG